MSLYKPILQADLSEPLSLDIPRGNVISFEVRGPVSCHGWYWYTLPCTRSVLRIGARTKNLVFPENWRHDPGDAQYRGFVWLMRLREQVAEHLSREDEDVYIDNVVSLSSSRLLLSWALPEACAPGRGYGATQYSYPALWTAAELSALVL